MKKEQIKKITYKNTTIYEGEPTKDGRKYFYRKSKNAKQKTSKKYLTKDECYKALSLFITKKDDVSNIKFILVADDYFKNLYKESKESTVDSYTRDYHNHIYPYFKSSYINKVDINNMREWAEELEKKGYKINYLNKVYGVLKNIFDFGMKYYNLEYNPASRYGRFKSKNDEVKKDEDKLRYITINEYYEFISVIDDPLWYNFFNTLFYTGCRKGEVMALNWKDIDFKNNVIKINKTLCDKVKGKVLITSTKNNKNRQIVMNNDLRIPLLNYYKKMKEYADFSEDWYVFGNTRFLPSTTVDRRKKKYFEISGVREITIHEFRHSIISHLINTYIEYCRKLNIAIDTERFFIMLSKRDGHSVEVLKRTYMHLFPTIQNEIVDLLNMNLNII